MNPTYAGGPTLTNWLLDFIWDQPEGATLSKIVRSMPDRWKKQSVPPTLTYLKDLGLLKREDSMWKAART
jgi:hypothetical protein